MEDEIKKASTTQLVSELTNIGNEIDMLNFKYEKIRLELIRRFPKIENDAEFQPKKLKKSLQD